MTFEEVWAQLEADDPTGAYKRAREMAELAVEQLEYAYNNGYAEAKKEFERPQGEWISVKEKDRRDSEIRGVTVKTLSAKRPNICSLCGDDFNCQYNFCPTCGTDMRGVKK